jgi:hypothetical protein
VYINNYIPKTSIIMMPELSLVDLDPRGSCCRGSSSSIDAIASAAATDAMNIPTGSAPPQELECKIAMLFNYYTVGACFFSENWIITSETKFAVTCIAALVMAMTLELLRQAVRNYDRIVIRQLETRQLEADEKNISNDQERAATHNEKDATNNIYTVSDALPGTTAAFGHAVNPRTVADGTIVGETDAEHPDQSVQEPATRSTNDPEVMPVEPLMTPAVSSAPESAQNPRISNNLARSAEASDEQAARVMASGQEGGIPRHILRRRWYPTWWQQLIRALIHTVQFVVAYFIMLFGKLIRYAPVSLLVRQVVDISSCGSHVLQRVHPLLHFYRRISR